MADSEDEETPPERDVKDFSFKQMRKIRMFDAPTSLPTARSSLLATSTKYGLIFVGCPSGIRVIKSETIELINESDEGSMQNIVRQCNPSSFIEIGHSVRFVGITSDDLTLSVCYENGNHTVMGLFDVPTLGSSNYSNAKFGEITLTSEAGVSVGNLLWNPGFPGIFAVCFSSGCMAVMELTETEVKTLASLPGSVKASAICWSPKGKQLVVGHRDGSLTQYTHELEVKKEIECPEIFIDDPHSVTDLLWITATLFAVVYSSFEDGDAPKFQLISIPKNEPRTITNFDDIYYVMSEERQPVFYFKNIPEWTMLVSAGSNGFEAAVIGKYGGEASTTWEKWNFEETGRAEMPLTNNNDETFPMGLAFDFSSTRPVAVGEKQLPPAPIMMLLSTDGVLCPFYMINQTPHANYDVIKALEPLPPGGQRKRIVSNKDPSSAGPVGMDPQGSVPSSLGTAADLPVGVFSLAVTKPTATLSSGPGPLSSGGHAFASYKQPVSFSSGTPTSATPSSATANAFSFGSPKQSIPSSSGTPSSGMSGSFQAAGLSFGTPKQAVSTPGNAPGSAFSSTNQKQSGSIGTFKLPTQSQVPATESGKPLGSTPQLVKPTPTNQTQPVNSGLPSFQRPSLATATSAKAPSQNQDLNLGSGQPKTISSVPSQVSAGQGLLAQPKPTPAKPVVTRAPGTRKELYNEESSSLPETKSAPMGLKLPGRSTVTEAARQEATKKTVPVSKGNVIEASVSENIQEAISHFNKEMAKLRDNVKSMQRNCCLTDDNKDLASFRKTTDGIGRTLADIKTATKDQQKDIDDEKGKLFEAFEMLEDARIRQEKKSDPRYVQLLKSRALDPLNTNKMREIRNLHLYLDKTLREVNMVLDEQWNKENDQKRSIQRPALDEVYQTLKVHHKIAQDQAAKLEQITQDMKNRKLLSTTWQRSSIHTASVRESSSLGDPFAVSRQQVKSPAKNVSAQISPQKQARLRSMFQKRGNTPVRRSRIVPSAVTKTPIVKPSRSEVPVFSSTPAIKPDDTAEGGSKGSFSFGNPIPEQSEVSDSDESPTEGSQEEESGEEQELEQWNVIHKASPSGPGPSPIQSGVTSSSKGGFSLGSLQGDAVLKKQPQPVRITAAVDSSQVKSISQPAADGAFAAVDKSGVVSIKPPGPQTTQAEPAKPLSGLFIPTTKAQPSPSAAVPPKSDFIPNVKVISTETPPNVAAAMAAMSRASASQGAVQSSSNLDPSASIEPVTLVTYKPQTQGGAQAKDYDAENNAAKAIANAALMAATAEAQKPSTKPQCSTEFIFKSTDSGKPGPPVVTFKPPSSSPLASESATKVTGAPNVTVNPTQVFKPAFAPAMPGSSTASKTAGLQQSFTGTQAAGSFSQPSPSGAPFSFAPPTGSLFNLGSSAGAAASATSTFSFSSKTKDTVPSQISAASVVAPNAAKPVSTTSASPVSITPSTRVSRTLFAAGDLSSSSAPTSGEQDTKLEDSKDVVKTVQVTTATPTTSSSGIVTPATATAATTGFAFSAPAPSGEGFFKNLNLASPSNLGNPPSILGALMRSSGSAAGDTSNLFGMAPTSISTPAASTPSTASSQGPLPSKGTPSENKDTSTTALMTPPVVGVSTSAGGIFAQALSESSKSNTLPSTTAVSTLPVTGSIFSAPATTTTSAQGGVFGLSLGGAKPAITAPSTTTTAGNLLSLSAGSGPSAFSATNTATPFFPSISPASTTASAPTGSTSLTAASPPTTTITITSPTEGSSTSATSTGSLFSSVTSTPSAFGVVVSTTSSGIGSLGAPSTTGAGSLFGTSTSTAFAPTPVFGTSSGNTFGVTQPFGSPASSQGNTFGSAPVFESPSATAGTGSGFGASTIGQSSFAPATSTGFGAASKPSENALGFGFGGFGLGGQASSQASKTNPFGVTQGFGGATPTQSSLFGGKSGADVFKMTDSSKPAFGGAPFSQSGFGSQSSGGFSGGSFSTQGGSVAASGFGFGASSPSGFGSPQPFGSPSAGGSVFGGVPSFGSAPAFGGAPAFGSSPQGGLGASPSGGVFGSATTGGFGQSQGSPTFGSLATQSNVPTFGAVAGISGTQGFGGIQQTQQAPPTFGSFGGGSSQSPGGTSFSQWR